MAFQGQNLPGFERVCGSCQKRCQVFTPDNVTPLDVCPECWGTLNIVQKLMILQAAKQVKHLSNISNVITEHIHSGDALKGKMRKHEGN